jgi:hypothetical protein
MFLLLNLKFSTESIQPPLEGKLALTLRESVEIVAMLLRHERAGLRLGL